MVGQYWSYFRLIIFFKNLNFLKNKYFKLMREMGIGDSGLGFWGSGRTPRPQHQTLRPPLL